METKRTSNNSGCVVFVIIAVGLFFGAMSRGFNPLEAIILAGAGGFVAMCIVSAVLKD